MAIIPADEKVFMVDKRTNTTYGGSQALQDMQQWYTMQDVSDSVQPYRVFTALLTQSGGDDPGTKSDGDLEIGVTYYISSVDDGVYGDFTNVGAPNNDIGTYFVATGETPNKWGKTSLAYNTGAPVVTVLENTIGNIWFTYDIAGHYIAYMPPFPEQKQVVFSPTSAYKVSSKEFYIDISNDSIDGRVNIVTTDGTSLADNDAIEDFPIEIRVYN
jgi:hypothetical protein